VKLPVILAVIGAVLSIVSTLMGAHLQQWEMILWPALTIAWALLALSQWERNR
jgi:hypothetical protein